MCKQYFVEFESDKIVCRSKIHIACRASTIKSAKSIIRNIRKNYAEENPRNFKVFDSWADVDEETNFVPCVYEEK